MSSNSEGKIIKRANPSTIQDKFLVGYQGWFTCPGDGEPVNPGHHGWIHWFNQPIPTGGHPNTDLWPDVSDYTPSELYQAPGLNFKNGESAMLFSSRNPKTVRRHFNWMAQHSVDGCFLQRFVGQIDTSDSRKDGIRRIRDEVGDRVREAAEAEGRVWAIMYDVTGIPPSTLQSILEKDWMHLVRDKRILESPNYLREKGRAVIGIWGLGFSHTKHPPSLLRSIASFFRSQTRGGAYIFAGTPAHWRLGTSDADRNPEWVEAWTEEVDAICPWTVGRYKTADDVDAWGEQMIRRDVEFLKRRNDKVEIQGVGRKVDYVPVVLPGGSGFNLTEGKWAFNDIRRNGGKFLWKQVFHAKRHGVRIMYGAMWDEYDEGTAFLPIVTKKRLLPESENFSFMALDEDGYDLPADWYMRICGFAAEGLRSERMVHETFPSKELQDYWASRPKYEDPVIITAAASGSSSSAAASGSMSASVSGSVGVGGSGNGAGAGGSGSGSGADAGEAYQSWLAQQKEEKDEVPPPPYSLEAEEPAQSQPSQTQEPESMASSASGHVDTTTSTATNQAHSSSTSRPGSRPSASSVSRPGTGHSLSHSPTPSTPSIHSLTSDFGRQSLGTSPAPGSSSPPQPWQPQQHQAYSPGSVPSTSPQPWGQNHPYSSVPNPSQPYSSASSPPPGSAHPSSQSQPPWQQHHQPYPTMGSPQPGSAPSQPPWPQHHQPTLPVSSPPPGQGSAQPWQQQQQSYPPISSPPISTSPPAHSGSLPPTSSSPANESQSSGNWSQGQWPPPEWNVKPSQAPQPSQQGQGLGLGRGSSTTTSASYAQPSQGVPGLGRASSSQASYQSPATTASPPPVQTQPPSSFNPAAFPEPHIPSFVTAPAQSPQSPPPPNPSQFQPTPQTGYFNAPPHHQQQHYPPQHQQRPPQPQHHGTYPGYPQGAQQGSQSVPFHSHVPQSSPSVGYGAPGPGPSFPGGPSPAPPIPPRPSGSLPPPPPHPGYNQPLAPGPSMPVPDSLWNAVDTLAGEDRRKKLEQATSKLYNKFAR